MKVSTLRASLFASCLYASTVLVEGFCSNRLSCLQRAKQIECRENKLFAVAEEGGNQAQYGDTLPLPDTYAKCGRCSASFAVKPEDLGMGKGCRVSCSLCGHSWFQGRDKLYNVRDGFELVPFPEHQVKLVTKNVEAGRRPDFPGVSKLYVGNLDFGVSEADLIGLFEKAGDVGEVAVARDTGTGRGRGFAFVTMMTEDGGNKGMELDGEELLGRTVQVRPPNN